ncbi:MAG: ribonuclease H-like domain-containing protein [Myxococcales bacterium]|nr:ribonuclease H-like domain-containing protein [Myxococcales bacterium]
MDLKARLLRLPALRPASSKPEQADRGQVISAALLASRLTPHGKLHLVYRRHPPEHTHGRHLVAQARLASPATIGHLALDRAFERVDPSRMLLLDTETTGLSGGAGTLPFLVGMGCFEGDALELEQLVLPRPGEEAPILARLSEKLSLASLLVTFNGKSFDWPLLRNRFVLNRLSVPRPPPHLDLLHCARRVFGRRLGSMRLGELEREVLGHARADDIPGSEIPAAYFEFLRSGEAGLLAAVLEHNAEDILALAALLAALVDALEGRVEPCDARDCLSLAHLASRCRLVDRARAFAQRAVALGCDCALAVEALRLLATLSLRGGDFSGAAAALDRALALGRGIPGLAAELHLSLAKLREHRLRDLPGAAEHARRSAGAEDPDDHARRLSRLDRRMEARRQLVLGTPPGTAERGATRSAGGPILDPEPHHP